MTIRVDPSVVEVNGISYTQRPRLGELVSSLGSPEVKTLKEFTIDGKLGVRKVEFVGLGISATVSLPESEVSSIDIRFIPDNRAKLPAWEGTVYLSDRAFTKGSTVKQLSSQRTFRFENGIAVSPGVSLMYQSKFEVVESLTIAFPTAFNPAGSR